MSESLELAQETRPSIDRRRHARLQPRTLTYAELDRENGGIVLDASESGISVHAVVPLTDDVLPELRLKLPGTNSWLVTCARVAWMRDSGKVAGLQFEGLSEAARFQIRDWLSKEAPASELGSTYPEAPPENHRTEETVSQTISNNLPEAELPRTGLDTLGSPVKAPQNSEGSGSAPARAVHSSVVVIDGLAKTPPEKQAAQRTAANLVTEEAHRGTPIYILLAVLAVISLASGWAAGRGDLRPTWGQFRAFFESSAVQRPVSKSQDSDALSAPVGEIQVLDANGQVRMVSLASTYSANTPAPPKPIISDAATTKIPNSGAQGGLNFQIWTLSSPERSAASRSSGIMRGSAPPNVEDNGGGPDMSVMASNPVEPPSPAPLLKPEIMAGVLKRGELIHRVEPEYPEIAREQSISGTVTLQATVDPKGIVRDVRVINGSKLLVRSAIDAVRQWRYTPTLLDGKAVETQVQISLVFNFTGNR